MVDSSKILTVSYGTFSCTLEGFDDSFGTMKAIAEYFRDLAADDRYFGAEPPAPDVQMLAKIAEREITRRVDASTTDGGIVLRAQQAPAPAMPPQVARPDPVQAAAAAVVPQVAAQPARMTNIEEEFETAHLDATAPKTELVAGPEAEETVSSPLVVSGQATPDAAPDNVVHPDAQSVAAKLQRIRAVVGQSDAPAASDYVEDQHAPDMPDTSIMSTVADAVEPDVSVAEDVGETPVMPDISDAPVQDAAPFDDENDDDALLSSLSAKIAQPAPAFDAPVEDVADVQDDVEDIVDVPTPEIEETVAEAPAAKPAIRAHVLRLRKADKPVDDSSLPAADSFAFVEDDLDDGSDMEDDVLDVARLDGVEAVELPTETTLSDDDEADLMDELAEVERDFAQEAPLADVAEVDEETPEVAVAEEDLSEEVAPAAKARNSLPDTDDSMMSHIMDQTDQQLNEPEGSRRRNAIAQLKAAVAATEAARQLGDTPAPATEAEDAFRGDLDEVVRPRRAPRAETPVERTARPRPAPLKLVASQRVDAQTPVREAAVAPRRVAAPVEQVSETSASNFAEFVEERGITALPDLLEAAAAYTAYVEGSEDFSRPQIMKKVQATSDENYSREDQQRSFGTLLREGRISKVRNGRFQVSEETRFKPEAKAG